MDKLIQLGQALAFRNLKRLGDAVRKYSPDQPRDEDGKFSDEGGTSPGTEGGTRGGLMPRVSGTSSGKDASVGTTKATSKQVQKIADQFDEANLSLIPMRDNLATMQLDDGLPSEVWDAFDEMGFTATYASVSSPEDRGDGKKIKTISATYKVMSGPKSQRWGAYVDVTVDENNKVTHGKAGGGVAKRGVVISFYKL